MSYVGRFILKFPKKYMGVGASPVYKSGLEAGVFNWMDTNNRVVRWAYELLKLPYYSPLDHKIHQYHTDIYCEIIGRDGKLKRQLIEIKSTGDMIRPKQPKNLNTKSRRNYMLAMASWIRNNAKWAAAKQYCQQAGIEFKFLTEESII